MRAAWEFIAGTSPYGPLAIAAALAAGVVAKHAHVPDPAVSVAYVAIVVAGLTLGTFDSR